MTSLRIDFDSFKGSRPAQAMFRKLGFAEYLQEAASWRQLRELIVNVNDSLRRGCFVEAARHCDGGASSGERVLLHALLYVTDFAWLADELTAGRAWRQMSNVSGAYREAVAACIAAEV